MFLKFLYLRRSQEGLEQFYTREQKKRKNRNKRWEADPTTVPIKIGLILLSLLYLRNQAIWHFIIREVSKTQSSTTTKQSESREIPLPWNAEWKTASFSWVEFLTRTYQPVISLSPICCRGSISKHHFLASNHACHYNPKALRLHARYPLKAVTSGLERHQLYIMVIALACLLPEPYEQISLFPFPLQHLSLGTASAGSATSDTAPPCPLCSQRYRSRRDTVLVCPSSESLCAHIPPVFPTGFLSSVSSLPLQPHHPSQPCTPCFPAGTVPVGNTCIAATAAVSPCPAQPPRGFWVL